MLVLRSEGNSYPLIGKMFNKDHSTIIHWCRKFSVDIGTPVPSIEEFGWKVNKQPPPNKYKYMAIIDEPINKGKKNYAEYLLEYQKRK